jgi:hypothetical protein
LTYDGFDVATNAQNPVREISLAIVTKAHRRVAGDRYLQIQKEAGAQYRPAILFGKTPLGVSSVWDELKTIGGQST